MARCLSERRDGSLEGMPRLPIRAALALPGLCAAALLLAACGDGADPTPAENTATSQANPSTAASTATVLPTRTTGFGQPPVLGGNVTKVSPEHGTTVTQQSTRSPIAERPGGVCAEVNFEGLPENFQWFRMAITQEGQSPLEVTQELTLVAAGQDAEEGKLCWAPEAGLPVGRYQAAIAVQNPNNPNESTRQLVGWEFDVK